MDAPEPQEDSVPVSPVVLFLQKNSWVYGVVVVALIVLVAGGIYLSNRPQHGTWRYGVCRALMDFEFAYPPTFDILSVAEESTSVRFFMAEKNPFGNERILQIDCDYKINGSNVALAQLQIDRKAIQPARLEYYNQMLPVLLSLKQLDTVIPPPLPRSLDLLKR